MSKVVCRIQKINSMSTVGKASKHNMRLESDANREHIMPSPTGCTLLLGSNNIVEDVKARLNDATKNANGEFRSNAVLAVEMILSASPDYFTDDKALTEWTEKNLDWLKKQYGKNVVNVTLHTDEQTPHLHVFIVPIDEKNKLNCREFFGGKEKLKELQTNSYQAVKDLGIQRGTPKEITGATHKKTSTWRREQQEMDADKKSLTKAIEKIEPMQANFTGLVKVENADLYYKDKALQSVKKTVPSKILNLTKENNNLKTKYNELSKENKNLNIEKIELEKNLEEAKRIAEVAKRKWFKAQEEIKTERENIAKTIQEAYEKAIEQTLENVERDSYKEMFKASTDKKQTSNNIKKNILGKLR